MDSAFRASGALAIIRGRCEGIPHRAIHGDKNYFQAPGRRVAFLHLTRPVLTGLHARNADAKGVLAIRRR
jgi:hypothetical protein